MSVRSDSVKMHGAPQVSILMSVYNKGRYLRDALESILNQSMTDFEFIIRDNCSSDNSVSIVESIDDPRIRFSRNSRNLGPVVSVNLCIEEARGRYCVFAHGDDIWEKDFLAVSISELERHHQVQVVHSRTVTIDDHGAPVTPGLRIADGGGSRLSSPDEALRRLFKGCYVAIPTVVVRREALTYLDPRYIYTCDWDLWLRIAGAGGNFLFIDRPLIRYRVTSGSETSVGVRSGEMILESYLTLRNFFLKNPGYLRYKRDALWRLSRSIMRRSRDLGDRDTVLLFHQIALLCAPINMINPVFHLFFLTGRLFGPPGMHFLKNVSRRFSRRKRS